ncbi:hypothetical protein [Capnocytophaga leadbetteri]|uniref:hypothetical protein n=1 Tax=Capnocytophaga leadbetteri TaxID=327575 RepID=UPI0028ED97B0|nr:hypothetical protein [Capnocytophaga leadbetteri]
MKKFFIALMASVALVGCGKDDNNDTGIQEGAFPKKITTTYPNRNRSTVEAYNIQNGKLLSATITEYENGVQTGTAQIIKAEYLGDRITQTKYGQPFAEDYAIEDYTYDGQGRVIKETRVEPHRTTEDGDSYTKEYRYEGEQLTKIIRQSPTTTWIDGENKKVNRHSEKVLAYSGSDIIVNETITYRDGNGAVVSGTETYTYTGTTTYTIAGGNLIKKVEGTHITEYKYDSNINPMPLNALLKTTVPDYFLKENYSKNNLIEEVESYTDYLGNLVKDIISIELTYNSKGYPTMKKFFRQRGSETKTLKSIEEIEY